MRPNPEDPKYWKNERHFKTLEYIEDLEKYITDWCTHREGPNGKDGAIGEPGVEFCSCSIPNQLMDSIGQPQCLKCSKPIERGIRTFIITLERTQNGKKLDWTAKKEIKAYEPPKIGTGRTLLVDPPIYETVTKIEEIVTKIVNYAENENGINTKENELPTP